MANKNNTHTYNVKFKVIPSEQGYAPFFLSGVVVANNPKEAESAAKYSAEEWIKSLSKKAELKMMFCKNLKANDFFIDANKVQTWKEKRQTSK